MSAVEFERWLEYNEHEPLNILELQLAQLSTMVGIGLGGKGKFEDFYPGKLFKKEEDEQHLDSEALNDYIKGMF